MKILIADDDCDLVTMLAYWLQGYGHEVLRASDGQQAVARWRQANPDLVLLDIEMPHLNGFEVLHVMARESAACVLFLTDHQSVDDEVRALDLGADDFLLKPFPPRQLLARIRALARRASLASAAAQADKSRIIERGSFALDPLRHQVTCRVHRAVHGAEPGAGIPVRLTPTESRLLQLLMANAGQVLPLHVIVERVWGYDDADAVALIKTHIRHLRQKIEPEPNAPRYLTTVSGVGYTFSAAAAPASTLAAPRHHEEARAEAAAVPDIAGMPDIACGADASPFAAP